MTAYLDISVLVPVTARYVFLVIVFICALSTIPATSELQRLEEDRPDLLLAVGIVNIDWWFRCIRGIYRLGWTHAGKDLPMFTRTVFKLVIVGYVLLAAFAIASMTGNAQWFEASSAGA